MISSIIIVFVIIFLFAALCPDKKSSRNPHPLPPGPTPLPYIGCTIQMLLNKLINQPIFRWIEKLMDKFKTPILCIKLGPSTHVITIKSPDLACEFFKKQEDIFISRPEALSAFLITRGYLTAALAPFGDQWRKMRTVLHHNVLSTQAQKWLEPKREDEANHLISDIYTQIENQGNLIDGGKINIRILTRNFSANIMTQMIFGKRLFGEGMEAGGSSNEESVNITALFTLLQYLYAFCISDYFPWLRGKVDIDGHEKKTRKAVEIVRTCFDPLVDHRIQIWESGARIGSSDLLDAFIKAKLTPDEIKAQIIELMIATVDNPSNAVEWAMGEMLNAPILLNKAMEELDHVVGRNRLVEEQDVPQLNYIKACVKESFRLHPFAPFTPPHVSIVDTTVAGYFIPKDSHVLLSRTRLGRDPKVWVDPLRFDPERHLDGEGSQVVLSDDKLRMISFSSGKRGCPAVSLGSTITTMLLARMIQGFSWGLPDNESSIELVESNDDLCLAKPLVAVAKPRLPYHLYPKV